MCGTYVTHYIYLSQNIPWCAIVCYGAQEGIYNVWHMCTPQIRATYIWYILRWATHIWGYSTILLASPTHSLTWHASLTNLPSPYSADDCGQSTCGTWRDPMTWVAWLIYVTCFSHKLDLLCFLTRIWQFPLELLHPRNPPNRESLISRYLAVQIQIETLFKFELVPKNLTHIWDDSMILTRYLWHI